MEELARAMLREFKGDSYLYGWEVLKQIGPLVAPVGRRVILVRSTYRGSDELAEAVQRALRNYGIGIAEEVAGAQPNAPREDLYRITSRLGSRSYEVVVALGGGSTIDATKAALVLRVLDGQIDRYFGVNQVTKALERFGKQLPPLVAVQTAASSAAHLTKYSNITDLSTGQKKLIVDQALVPTRALFDYRTTVTMSPSFTADGAMDGQSHIIEVLYGAVGKPHYEKLARIARVGLSLLVDNVERAIRDPQDREARIALGLATDLGGYAIMSGSTNGGHLTSFSLVDVASHGRACAVVNPYYTLLFAPAIEPALHLIAQVYRKAGLFKGDPEKLHGRELGRAVAEAMLELNRRIGIPTRLADLPGFSDRHIERALQAAKDPQLKVKLENMPVPMSAETVDEYMGSVLRAARDGDLELVADISGSA